MSSNKKVALNKNYVLFNLLLLVSYLISSCGFLNFDLLEIECSVSETDLYYFEDEIILKFSFPIEEASFEKNVRLSKDGGNAEINFEWNEQAVKIWPKENWSLGSLYTLELEGNIDTKNKGTFKENLSRTFYYGEKDKFLNLESVSVQKDDEVSDFEKITFVFNKDVNQYSFLKNFSITPSIPCQFVFENSNVILLPLEKWKMNTTYEWVLSEVYASDGYCLQKECHGEFRGKTDKVLPEIIKVRKVREIKNLLVTEFDWSAEEFSSVDVDDYVGLEFSKAMDIESLEDALDFTPSVRGQLVVLPDSENKKFIFKSTENFDISQKYTLKITSVAKDLSGNPILGEPIYPFFCSTDFLKITEIKTLKNESEGEVIFDSEVGISDSNISSIEVNDENGESEKIEFYISFSTAIEREFQKSAVSGISLSAYFPLTETDPVLESARWSQDMKNLSLTYSNFSKSLDENVYYYQFKISGGKRGIKNSVGQYLKEDLCVTFRTE